MKLFKVVLCAFTLGLAASRPTADVKDPQGSAKSSRKLGLTDPSQEILSYDSATHSRLESGKPGVAVRGEYRFVDQGKEYRVIYIADHEGYRAQTDEVGVVSDPKELVDSSGQASSTGKASSDEIFNDGSKQSSGQILKAIAVPSEILSYNAETHSRMESGQPGVAVSGEYHFTNDDKQYKVTYIADEQGFRAQGDHIPVAVPAVIPSSNVQPAQKASLAPSSQSAVQKTSSDSIEILNYDAETHSRLETGQPGVAVSGEYKYTNDDKQYKVTYVADDQGFRAQGDHIPVAAPAVIPSSNVQPAQKASLAPSSQSAGQKTSSDSIEILNYDAETHSRLETGQPGVAVSGEYKYTNDDKQYKVTYVADEQGFRAQGDHIPVAVPAVTPSSNVQPAQKASLAPSATHSQSAAQKTSSDSIEILNYDAETHSRLETGQPGVAVSGEYKYTNDDKQYKVTYVADEQGFRAQGDHIPVAAPAIIPSSNVQPVQKASLAPSATHSQSAAQKTSSDSIEILNYDAETHSRLETGQPGVAVSGEYKYTNDDKQYKVTYVADEQGFRAQGDHIPVAAPAIIPSSNVQPVQKASLAPSASYSQLIAQKTSSSGPIEILNYDAETHTRQESGEPGVAVKGQFTFKNDNKDYKVIYIADENGFRAEGDHIPALPKDFFKSVVEKAASSDSSESSAVYNSQQNSAIPVEILNYDAETHSRQEVGVPGVAVKGGYKYFSEGKEYLVAYIADDQGFRIESEHVADLPQSSQAQFSKDAALQNQEQGEETDSPASPSESSAESIEIDLHLPSAVPEVQILPSDETADSDSAAQEAMHNPANCDQLTKSVAPLTAPAYLVPLHFPSVHPFGYYIVQVKESH